LEAGKIGRFQWQINGLKKKMFNEVGEIKHPAKYARVQRISTMETADFQEKSYFYRNL